MASFPSGEIAPPRLDPRDPAPRRADSGRPPAGVGGPRCQPPRSGVCRPLPRGGVGPGQKQGRGGPRGLLRRPAMATDQDPGGTELDKGTNGWRPETPASAPARPPPASVTRTPRSHAPGGHAGSHSRRQGRRGPWTGHSLGPVVAAWPASPPPSETLGASVRITDATAKPPAPKVPRRLPGRELPRPHVCVTRPRGAPRADPGPPPPESLSRLHVVPLDATASVGPYGLPPPTVFRPTDTTASDGSTGR